MKGENRMPVFEGLEPKDVLEKFEDICSIPRASYHTKAISDYIAAFAEERHLKYIQDGKNNIIVFKGASKGLENAGPVIIQGHTDIVCEKDPGVEKNMLEEGLDLAVDGDLIYAKGTTLGGDDGIAVAMMLELLDGDYAHPPLECVFTSDEEVGMLGAVAIDLSPLKGRRLLNIDSEEEGVFTAGCAGGVNAEITLPVKRAACGFRNILRIDVDGLTGGHSGAEIDKGRANALKALGRVLYEISKRTEIRLISVSSGGKSNVIPKKSSAVISADDFDLVCSTVETLSRELKNEYAVTDSGIKISAEKCEADTAPMDAESTRKAVALLYCIPNGIIEMSADIESLVQTSLNLGILECGIDKIRAVSCIRSSIASQKRMVLNQVECLVKELGGTLTSEGDYPCWEYKRNSELRNLMAEVFTGQYGYAPKIGATHAGLECGIFCGKIEGLDCISYGPDLKDIHTSRETLSVSSLQRVWKMTLEVLKRMN